MVKATTRNYSIKSTNKQDAVRRCLKGYDCEFTAREKLKHFVSKEAFNIEGLGKKVIDKFWDLKMIKEPKDIFSFIGGDRLGILTNSSETLPINSFATDIFINKGKMFLCF